MRSKEFWKIKKPSPCIKECKLDGVYCKSCGRHQDDIRMWSTYSDEKCQEIMNTIEKNKS